MSSRELCTYVGLLGGAVAALFGGEVFTGYFAMGTMDKALMATNIQADATVDAICANGPLIQQAWEEDTEDE